MKIKVFDELFVLLIGLLVLIWPMQHLIAVRNIDILVVFLFSLAMYSFYPDKFSYKDRKVKYLFFLFLSFIIWAIFISYISPFKESCLIELYKEFPLPLLLIMTAYFIAHSNLNINKIFITIFAVLIIFPLYHALYSFHFFLYHNHFPFRSYGITVGLDEINFLMPYLLSFFAIEIIFRTMKKKTILPISNTVLGVLLFVVLFSLYVQAKRNGIVSVAFSMISIIFFIKLIQKTISKKLIIFSLIGVIVGSSLVYLDFKEDPRWKSLIATAKIVFIQDSMLGLNFTGPRPKLPNGQEAYRSNYERLLMIREGLKLMKDNPFGYGYDRNIYGKAISKKYHINNHTHSHSGFIDWGVSLGIVGLLIWSAICFLILVISFRNFINYKSYYALLALFLTTSFYFRMFLDSINKDHMLEQFVFFTSLAFFAMQKELHEKNNISQT